MVASIIFDRGKNIAAVDAAVSDPAGCPGKTSNQEQHDSGNYADSAGKRVFGRQGHGRSDRCWIACRDDGIQGFIPAAPKKKLCRNNPGPAASCSL
jgi:hypothetical protein